MYIDVHVYVNVHVHPLFSLYQIFNFVRDKEGFIPSFLNHLGTSAIMDLLLQMVAAPDNDQCRVDLAWVLIHVPLCIYTCMCTCKCAVQFVIIIRTDVKHDNDVRSACIQCTLHGMHIAILILPFCSGLKSKVLLRSWWTSFILR